MCAIDDVVLHRVILCFVDLDPERIDQSDGRGIEKKAGRKPKRNRQSRATTNTAFGIFNKNAEAGDIEDYLFQGYRDTQPDKYVNTTRQ